MDNERTVNNGLTCPVCRSVVEPSHSISLFSDEESPGQDDDSGAKLNGPADDIRQVGKLLSTLQDKWEGALLERAALRSETGALKRKLALYESELARVTYENKLLQKLCNNDKAAAPESSPVASKSGARGSDGKPFYPGSESKSSGGGGSSSPSRKSSNSTTVVSGIAPALPSSEYEKVTRDTWVEERSFETHHDAVHSIDIHPNGKVVVSASWDNSFVLTNLESGHFFRVAGHSSGLYTARFSKKNPSLVGTASGDNTARLWRLSNIDGTGEDMNATCEMVYDGHLGEVNGMCFHEDEDVLASASDDKFAYVFDLETNETLSRLAGHQMEVYGVCFQPGGRLLATGSFDHSCCVWDWRSGILVNTLQGHTDDVVGIDIDRTGLYLASGSDDCSCRVWDLRMAKTALCLTQHQGEVKRVRWSPYSRFLLTTSGDMSAYIWDRNTAMTIGQLVGHNDHVFDACFSPECDYIVTASHDKTWRKWTT